MKINCCLPSPFQELVQAKHILVGYGLVQQVQQVRVHIIITMFLLQIIGRARLKFPKGSLGQLYITMKEGCLFRQINNILSAASQFLVQGFPYFLSFSLEI